MKLFLFLLLSFPVFSFAQKMPFELNVGVGYAFYPGPSDQVYITSGKGGNPLQSGLTAEITADMPVGQILHLGVGASFFSFNKLGNPYIPVFADIRVIGQGNYKLYSFLNPGYGIFNARVNFNEIRTSQKGGFFIGYGVGVIHSIYYLQAKFNWLRFIQSQEFSKTTYKTYGVLGVTFGVHLP